MLMNSEQVKKVFNGSTTMHERFHWDLGKERFCFSEKYSPAGGHIKQMRS